MRITPVILSGGSGSRLWPLSTSEIPKQFLKLTNNFTMIQNTLLRLKGVECSAPIISCNENHRFLVAEQLSEVSDKKPKILLEPVAKNTAPAIAAACCAALNEDKNAIVAVFPSDHVIADEEKFRAAIKIAAEKALEGYLVTFGIVPTFPSTGYGYIKGNDNLEKFVEKPCLEKAEEYIASGQYSWNSGMFVFKASTFLSELEKFEPEMEMLSKQSYENAVVENDFIRLDKKSFEKIKGNSIDYAVMEHTKKGKVVKLDAGWSDVGSWAALWDINKKDEHGNVLKGKALMLDTKNSYVHSVKKPIAVIGLRDIVIVESENTILVAAKDKVQDVKKAAEEIKNL